MGWPRNLVLVRHAESVGNVMSVDERAAHESSSHAYELTVRGRRQAAVTGKWLRKKLPQFHVYFASYYTRSKETLAIMFPDEKLYEDPRLAEAQRGIYHTMTRAEIEAKYPEELVRKEREGLYHYRPLGGENSPDIELRIHSFLSTLNRDCDGQDVVMVVHGNWLILFQRLIERFSIEEALRRQKVQVAENASITWYENVIVGGKSRLNLKMENVVPWKGKLD